MYAEARFRPRTSSSGRIGRFASGAIKIGSVLSLRAMGHLAPGPAQEALVYRFGLTLGCGAAHQLVPPAGGLAVTPAKRVGVDVGRHADR